MGIFRGLASAEALSPTASGPKVRYLKIGDGKTVKLRLANEASADSPGYDESRGLVAVVAEHQNPKNFLRSAVCTMEDEGRCYGCEQHARDYKAGWYRKVKMYTNVLVDEGKGEKYIAVWSVGAGKKGQTYNTLRDFNEEYKTLTQNVWRVKRSGEGTETTYSVLPGPQDTEPFDWSEYELYDLDLVPRSIPYAEQEAFYNGVRAGATADSGSGEW